MQTQPFPCTLCKHSLSSTFPCTFCKHSPSLALSASTAIALHFHAFSTSTVVPLYFLQAQPFLCTFWIFSCIFFANTAIPLLFLQAQPFAYTSCKHSHSPIFTCIFTQHSPALCASIAIHRDFPVHSASTSIPLFSCSFCKLSHSNTLSVSTAIPPHLQAKLSPHIPLHFLQAQPSRYFLQAQPFSTYPFALCKHSHFSAFPYTFCKHHHSPTPSKSKALPHIPLHFLQAQPFTHIHLHLMQA